MALHHAKPGEVVDLRPLGPGLKEAKSTTIVKSAEFEAIRLIVAAGAEIPRHEVPGSITLHCLEGRIGLDLGGSSLELGASEWVHLEGGAPHAVRGIEDSSVLLTIMFDAGGRS